MYLINTNNAQGSSWSAPGALLLSAMLLAFLAMPEFARAGEFEYQECIRQLCTSYGIDDNNCTTQEVCLRELNGSSSTQPQARVAVRFGAIAVETATLNFGYVKDVASRAEAEKGALAYCRQAGGTGSGCEIAVWGHNTCLALATSAGGSKGNTWGYAWSEEGAISRREAMKACAGEGGSSCKVAVSFCTG